MIRQRSQSRRPAVVVLAVVALLVGLIGGLVPGAGAGADPSVKAVTGGSLDWGVKASFRNYVTTGAQGTITVAGGATVNPDGTFHFPAKAGGVVESTTSSVAASFDGSVQFLGHADGNGGFSLDVTISNIRIDSLGSAGTVVADVVSRPLTPGSVAPAVTSEGVALADLDLTGITSTVVDTTSTWTAVPSALAAAGAPAMAGFYPVGEALDPVTFSLVLDGNAATTTTTAPGSNTPAAADDSTTTTSSTSTTSTTIAPTTTTTVAQADEDAITGGYLDWGVRKSFLAYIKGPVAHGTVTVSDGAIDNTATGGTFRFPEAKGTFNGDTDATDVTFEGTVRFTGHEDASGPKLDLQLTKFRILRDATGSWLIADVVSLPFSGTSGSEPAGDPVSYPGLKVVQLDTTGLLPTASPPNGLTWHNVPTTLTTDAVPAFGNYAAGEAFDPVTYNLTFAEVPDVPLDPDGPTVPMAHLDKTQVRAGDPLTVTGEGFMAGEQVEVWLHSEPTWIATTTADDAGAVAYTFIVPVDTPPGVHHVELRGISSGTSLSSAEFTVLAGSGGSGSPTGAKASTGSLPRTGGGMDLARIGAFLVVAGAALTLGLRRRTRTA